MPAVASDSRSASALNCGLRRERGTARTSASCSMPYAARSARKRSIGSVEWPTVNTAPTRLASISQQRDGAIEPVHELTVGQRHEKREHDSQVDDEQQAHGALVS